MRVVTHFRRNKNRLTSGILAFLYYSTLLAGVWGYSEGLIKIELSIVYLSLSLYIYYITNILILVKVYNFKKCKMKKVFKLLKNFIVGLISFLGIVLIVYSYTKLLIGDTFILATIGLILVAFSILINNNFIKLHVKARWMSYVESLLSLIGLSLISYSAICFETLMKSVLLFALGFFLNHILQIFLDIL